MVQVLYKGDVNPARVNIGDMIIENWGTGEIRDIPAHLVGRLLVQSYFVLANKEEKVIKQPDINFDLNNDGKIDGKDGILAGKVLSKIYKKNK